MIEDIEPVNKKKYTLSDKALEVRRKGSINSAKISMERKDIDNKYKDLLKNNLLEKNKRELDLLDIPILNKRYNILEEETNLKIKKLEDENEHKDKMIIKLKDIINEMVKIDNDYTNNRNKKYEDIEQARFRKEIFGSKMIIDKRYKNIKMYD